MSNFYGGPLFETGATKVSGDDCLGSGDGCHIQLLGGVKTGLCRPRAILFKFLGDCVGIQSRLQMVAVYDILLFWFLKVYVVCGECFY